MWLPQLTLLPSCLQARPPCQPCLRPTPHAPLCTHLGTHADWASGLAQSQQARGSQDSTTSWRPDASLNVPGRRSAEGCVEEEERRPRGEQHQQRVAHVGEAAASAHAPWSAASSLRASASKSETQQPTRLASTWHARASTHARRGTASRQPTVEAGYHSASMMESCQSLKGCRVTETARKTAVVMAVSIFCSWRRLSPSDSKAACPTQSLRDASDRKKSA